MPGSVRAGDCWIQGPPRGELERVSGVLESGMLEGRGLPRVAKMTVPRPGVCLGVRAAVGSVYQMSFSGAEALSFIFY